MAFFPTTTTTTHVSATYYYILVLTLSFLYYYISELLLHFLCIFCAAFVQSPFNQSFFIIYIYIYYTVYTATTMHIETTKLRLLIWARCKEYILCMITTFERPEVEKLKISRRRWTYFTHTDSLLDTTGLGRPSLCTHVDSSDLILLISIPSFLGRKW